jgi:hypothetical protein
MRRHADPSRGLPCSSRHLGGAVERLDELHRRSSFVWAEARAKLGAQADTLGVAPGAIAEQRMRVAVGERRGFSGSRLWPLPNAAHGRRVRRITEQRRGRLPMPWRSREPSLHVEHHHPIRELWMSVMNGASGSSVLPAGRWSVDATRSSVAFAVGHMTLATVNGRFQEFDGALEIGSGTPRATGVVRAAAIDTDEPIRAEHLRRSRDFEHPRQLPSRNGTLAPTRSAVRPRAASR